MSITVIPIDPGKLESLTVSLDAWVSLVGSDRSKALIKAARLLDLGMHKAMRQSPPRPIGGRIMQEAKARGYTIGKSTASWKTGYSSAQRILGGNKSAFFRIVEVNGRKIAQAVGVTAKGNVTYSKRGKLRRGAQNLTTLSGQTKKPIIQIPSDWVRLNKQALAVNRALNIREKAAAGGYLASEFLTYRKISAKTKYTQFITKDGVRVGSVSIYTDEAGNPQSVQIAADVPGIAEVAARNDSVNKAFDEAVATFNSDIIERLNTQYQKAMEGLKK